MKTMNNSKKIRPIETNSFYIPYNRQVPKTNRITDRINREFISTYRDYEYDRQNNRTVEIRSIEAKV